MSDTPKLLSREERREKALCIWDRARATLESGDDSDMARLQLGLDVWSMQRSMEISSAAYARGLEDAAKLVESIIVSGPEDDNIDHDDFRAVLYT